MKDDKERGEIKNIFYFGSFFSFVAGR